MVSASPHITLDLRDDKVWNQLERYEDNSAQFRLRAGKDGVVNEHEMTEARWQKYKDKPLLLHRVTETDASGAKNIKFKVLDGHHRFQYFKKLKLQGKEMPQITADVLDEAAGYNVKTAKIEAAFRDEKFKAGLDDVIDTAYALKESREADVRQDLLSPLQFDKGNLKLALKLSDLSKESLKMVSRGEVPVEAAERVVELAKDDEGKQERAMHRIFARIRQDYPNYYTPNPELAGTLAAKANDNNGQQHQGFAAKELARRAANTQSVALGA